MSDLYRLVYASRNLIQGDDAEIAAAVLQILETSKRNNVKCDVTGALLFNKGAFAQVLEGPRAGVEETFERIQRDPRHGDVTVLQCGPTAERGFGDWSMAFVGHSQRGQAMWNDLSAESGFDLARLSGDTVFGMLHDLVLDEEGVLEKSVGVGTSARPSAERASLDATQVRAELAQLRTTSPTAAQSKSKAKSKPEEARPAAKPVEAASPTAPLPGAGDAPSSPMAVLKASLASERQRTSELRVELDDAHIALAMSHDQIQTIMRERDMWAERARLLARALDGAAEATLSSRPSMEPSMHERSAAGNLGAVRSAA